jgi:signal transduction histidine kinase
LARVGKEGQDANVQMVELQPQEAYLLLPEIRNRGYLINPHTRLARILRWKDVLVYNFDTEKPEMEQPQKGHQLMSILEAESLLSTPLVFNDQFWGQVYLINRTKGYFSSTDLQYLRLMIAQVASIIENYRLLKNMQAITVLEEKSRIARDLHDGLVQSLASLDVRLEVCRRLLDCSPEAIAKELEDLQKIVKSEHAGLREYMKQLRTARYPDKDLLKAVQKYAQTLEEENGLVVKISFDLEQIHLSAGVSAELYQIIHEGLTNIRKHAGARQALVHLGQDEKAIDLLIGDDGRGFPLGSNNEDTPRPPWSIAERTSALNGTLTVNSVPGRGSALHIRIPLARAREDAVPSGKEWEEDALPIQDEDSGTEMGQVRPC